MVQYNQQQQQQNLIPHTYSFFEKLNHSCGYVYTKYIFFDWNSKNFHCSAAVIIKCSAKAKLPRSAGSFFLCMMKKNYFQFQNIGQQLYSRHRQTMHLPNAFRFIHVCMLDILFSSNHNINKSSYGAFIFGLQTL